MTGASDGTLALWSQTKKRPTSILGKAHGYPKAGFVPQQTSTATGSEAAAAADADAAASRSIDAATNGGAAVSGPGEVEEGPVGPGSVGGDAASWIGAVGVCRGTDLVVGLCFVLTRSIQYIFWLFCLIGGLQTLPVSMAAGDLVA